MPGGTIITLAAYDIDRAFIFRDPATNITGANGHQQHRGIEVTAFGSPVQGLRLFGSFSTFDPTLKRTAGGLQDGTEPVGLAKALASANVDFDVPGVTGLAANFGAFYVGPSVINNANRIRLPGWARVDASLRYVFSVGDNEFRLQANVDNLLNKRAYQVDGGSYVKTLIRRTFSASLAVDF
ncbi:TonB-dependent receptor domain-containing protein [Leptolyngbya sp. 7M]|uniref:TonB-dependent receptor domain-containing protein n=1 Tax=Leptolyngbya sp. 7M TaxID=2812896 RepID=UPI001B8B7503|nr:TonB-dependent receptor [Leptolyngbya sp. 7M]QYO68719.1 TonB-dependent receptor [Leptolyngbya sp. 7M]